MDTFDLSPTFFDWIDSIETVFGCKLVIPSIDPENIFIVAYLQVPGIVDFCEVVPF